MSVESGASSAYLAVQHCLTSGAQYGRYSQTRAVDERVQLVAGRTSGFLYLVSLTGVTGARDRLPPNLEPFVARARAASDLPLAVGFGISTPDQAARVARIADVVIVGSALIRAIATGPDPVRAASDVVASLRAGVGRS